MGLLDGMLGNVLGGMMGGGHQGAQGQSPLLAIVLQLLQQNGGLQGMLGKLQQAGYGDEAQSWVGTGQNMPISPDALQKILGSGQLAAIAQQLGISPQDAAGGMAQMLPGVVDQMTPQGQVPDDHNDLVSQALAMLQKGR